MGVWYITFVCAVDCCYTFLMPALLMALAVSFPAADCRLAISFRLLAFAISAARGKRTTTRYWLPFFSWTFPLSNTLTSWARAMCSHCHNPCSGYGCLGILYIHKVCTADTWLSQQVWSHRGPSCENQWSGRWSSKLDMSTYYYYWQVSFCTRTQLVLRATAAY